MTFLMMGVVVRGMQKTWSLRHSSFISSSMSGTFVIALPSVVAKMLKLTLSLRRYFGEEGVLYLVDVASLDVFLVLVELGAVVLR